MSVKFGLKRFYPVYCRLGRIKNVCHISTIAGCSGHLVIRYDCRCSSRLCHPSELESIEKVDFLGFWGLGRSGSSGWRLKFFRGVDWECSSYHHF